LSTPAMFFKSPAINKYKVIPVHTFYMKKVCSNVIEVSKMINHNHFLHHIKHFSEAGLAY
jgi:hypothetical protein